MAYIHVFNGATQLSEGTGLTPLTVVLNASNNEVSAAQTLTVKCDTGYVTSGDTVISFQGTTETKWSICATADGTYTPTLTISTPITTTGTAFYVKAASSSDESPANDDSVDISVVATIAAV